MIVYGFFQIFGLAIILLFILALATFFWMKVMKD